MRFAMRTMEIMTEYDGLPLQRVVTVAITCGDRFPPAGTLALLI